MADGEISRRTFLSKSALVGGAALVGVGAATGLSGCSSGGASSSTVAGTSDGKVGVGTGAPVRGGTLTVGTSSEVNGFFPASANFDWTGLTYANTIYDPLVAVGSDGSFQPYLCQSITPNGAHDEWTLALRPGVTFHDGSPLDATVVLSNMAVLKASVLTGQSLEQVASVKASDPMTLVYTLVGPNPTFPLLLATQVGYVVGQAMIDQAMSGNASPRPVGTGPFVYSAWQPNESFTATRNPNYWRAGMPYLDQVVFRPIPDTIQRESSLRSGSVDLIVSNDPMTIERFGGTSGYHLADTLTGVIGEPSMNFICLNTAVAPTEDLSIRQALAMATSQATVQRVIAGSAETPVIGPFLPGSPYYADTGYPTYDPAGARKLVDKYKSSHSPPSLTLVTITDPKLLELTQLLQQMWQQVGFTVTIETVEQAELITLLLSGRYQAATVSQFGAVTPDSNYEWWSTTTVSPPGTPGLNFARNSDPAIESAMLQGRATTSAATRIAAYQSVARHLAEDLPYLWIRQTVFTEVADSRVQNFTNFVLPGGMPGYSFDEGVFFPTEIWFAD